MLATFENRIYYLTKLLFLKIPERKCTGERRKPYWNLENSKKHKATNEDDEDGSVGEDPPHRLPDAQKMLWLVMEMEIMGSVKKF